MWKQGHELEFKFVFGSGRVNRNISHFQRFTIPKIKCYDMKCFVKLEDPRSLKSLTKLKVVSKTAMYFQLFALKQFEIKLRSKVKLNILYNGSLFYLFPAALVNLIINILDSSGSFCNMNIKVLKINGTVYKRILLTLSCFRNLSSKYQQVILLQKDYS